MTLYIIKINTRQSEQTKITTITINLKFCRHEKFEIPNPEFWDHCVDEIVQIVVTTCNPVHVLEKETVYEK